MTDKKNIAIKIIIPIVILFVIIGIWVVKNSPKEINSVVTNNNDFSFDITEKIDIEKLKSYGLPIVIDFGADSCVPCREMAPILKELNQELQGRAIVRFVDISKYQDLAKDYPISVIPTQIFIDSNGNPYTPQNTKDMNMKFYSLKDTNEHILTVHEGGLNKEQLISVLKEMGLK